jgi:hypothetical protein
MTANPKDTHGVEATKEVKWGETRTDHFGYENEDERISKRGLEDWELVEKMTESGDHRIPYWFIGLFFVLLLVAIGLTFPFWGVRPGYERPWFDWGIVGGAAWVIFISAVIYYLIDYRHQRKEKKERDAKEKKHQAI